MQTWVYHAQNLYAESNVFTGSNPDLKANDNATIASSC